MNMGPVSENNYSIHIKKNINNKKFVLDFGSGAGFFLDYLMLISI